MWRHHFVSIQDIKKKKEILIRLGFECYYTNMLTEFEEKSQ